MKFEISVLLSFNWLGRTITQTHAPDRYAHTFKSDVYCRRFKIPCPSEVISPTSVIRSFWMLNDNRLLHIVFTPLLFFNLSLLPFGRYLKCIGVLNKFSMNRVLTSPHIFLKIPHSEKNIGPMS